MSLLSRLLGTGRDPRENLRPLWHRTVELSRAPQWYVQGQVVDSVAGRFDMIVQLTCLVILRLEREPDTGKQVALLIELFVADMDGQLRESGVGDLVVGKKIGHLVSVLGGRLGALRQALPQADDAALIAALERNTTLAEGATPQVLAGQLRAMEQRLAALPLAEVLEGRIA
ncbi:MAG: ubiquinol-cytochrome C chaperone family protein [Croceibacterium sp.]